MFLFGCKLSIGYLNFFFLNLKEVIMYMMYVVFEKCFINI